MTALLMGLTGGPHCAIMCGAGCAGIVRASGAAPAWSMGAFQAGRLLGYSLAGAVAAWAVQSLAWMSSSTAALRPLWTLFHLLVLIWGLMLLARARQPDWVSLAGRSLWMRVAPMARRRSGPVAAGMLWVFLPCGLLYSALLVASLSGGPLQGALSMALFAAGSSISLVLAPMVLRRLEQSGNLRREGVGTRAAGALLAIVALWALWHDMAEKILDWCAIG